MLELYQKAADQGLHAAQCALAKCYLYGRGVKLDWSKATTLMIAAAEGYPAAMVILARFELPSVHRVERNRGHTLTRNWHRWYEVGYYKLMTDERKAMEYAIRAVFEKEIDAWDIVIRYAQKLARHGTARHGTTRHDTL
jgi:TPR repeat protein